MKYAMHVFSFIYYICRVADGHRQVGLLGDLHLEPRKNLIYI